MKKPVALMMLMSVWLASGLVWAQTPNSLIVDVSGNVGMGTDTPGSQLHVTRSNGTAQVLVEETNAAVAARTLFQLNNRGNTKFNINNTNAGVEWAFTNSGTDFRISRQMSGVVELILSNTGNMTIQGNLTELSSRSAKHDIQAVDPEAVLNKVAELPLAEWTYKDDADVRHLGPMAEDFAAAFGLGATDTGIASIDTSGVALAAIQGLHAQNRELRAQIDRRDQRMSDLTQRLEQLERVVFSGQVALSSE